MSTTVAEIGFWSALATLVAAAGYSVVQIPQVVGLLTFPWDEILTLDFSIGIPVPFVVTMVALQTANASSARWP